MATSDTTNSETTNSDATNSSGTPNGTTTSGASGATTCGTTPPGTNLLSPGECDKPFPVPPPTRTYRIYVPLTDLVTTGGTPITSPHTIGTLLTFDPRSVALMDRAVDAFGGIPLNALDKAKDPRWSEPVLNPVIVSDPAALVRSMAIAQESGDVQLSLASTQISELLESGSTLAPRADGGFIRLKLAEGVKAPTMLHVSDFEAFLQEPSVVQPDGGRRRLKLTSAQLTSLASGRPVISGSGSNSLVLIRQYQPITPAAGNHFSRAMNGSSLAPPFDRPGCSDSLPLWWNRHSALPPYRHRSSVEGGLSAILRDVRHQSGAIAQRRLQRTAPPVVAAMEATDKARFAVLRRHLNRRWRHHRWPVKTAALMRTESGANFPDPPGLSL
jgi:hypothetical protein